jgi:DNA-binding NarL/FixJ family response regulator
MGDSNAYIAARQPKEKGWWAALQIGVVNQDETVPWSAGLMKARPNHKASQLRLALIDPRTLVRNAVAYLLQTWSPASDPASIFVVLPFCSIAEFAARHHKPANDFDLVALNVGASTLADERTAREVNALKEMLSNLPLVLMADCLEPKLALDLLRNGLKGYIPATSSPLVTIEALRLVRAGGTFIPPDLLQHAAGESPCDSFGADTDPIHAAQLTGRERTVLGLLRQGKPNKIIAADLRITENTVKVYVRLIMKKLGAINRTHACYLVQRAAEPGLNGAMQAHPSP